ncbi:MAG: hypothetical protein M9928_00745 [Anaerolineae bacterium]|nr:hypothetical protein [Anaerolineae bacterium]MCO5187859.1 hypothetical protein [Anaerolineae bacterium]MCO5199797.1 hypothetical protein [Anaerolineae bacterium]MCO5203536.1 hypothetical protein [Anaerolineae bacterium]
MRVKELQIEIEQLPAEEFAQLRRWFIEKDWDQWDQQLEADVASGRLDILLEEAKQAKEQNSLENL